jgi:hypothetical protein
MSKILEVAIAIILLLFFVFFAMELHTNEINNINYEKYKDIVELKVQNESFREIVDDQNTYKVYKSLEPYIDTLYTVEICNYINDDCKIENIDLLNSEIYSFDYYLADLNKTLYVIIKK